ncbi:MAG: decarboxylase [Chloroflexi bacterium]|nr:decarboxylase [Chloroflexota bacterium]
MADTGSPWWQIVYERFKAHGIGLVVHVPDAALVGLIGTCDADPDLQVLQLTREEEGVGVLSGAYLGGTRGALLMQSSGLGTCVNALGGLPMAYRIPFVMLITPRGRLSEFNPSQVPAGRAVPKVLDALGIETVTLERLSEVETTVDQAIYTAFSTSQPVAIIASTLLTGGKRR